MTAPLLDRLAGGAFQGYAYAYPHKTAYRGLDPPMSLRDVWASEDKSALFLYLHVPFCEMRCGFCNLFTTTNPGQDLVTRYLDALRRQVEATTEGLGSDARFARLAVGGGTPTFLTVPELDQLFTLLKGHFRGIASAIPKAIEASPATIDEEKLALLSAQGVTRVSLGVQSFLESEVRSLGRSQRNADVQRALLLLKSRGFPCLNIDLIYGVPEQTATTWKRSLEEALEFAPQEIYLYPLYVRPLTGLHRVGSHPTDDRLSLYRVGRDFLLSHGYRQISMRLFRSLAYTPLEGPVYCCQEDGMVGLGAGARSYTAALHYSTEYAVGLAGVRAIIEDFTVRTRDQFAQVDYGCTLDRQEQQRRYILKSLLRLDGLNLDAYQAQFGTDPFVDFMELGSIEQEGLGCVTGGYLQLNTRGLELSDVIGPWLFSPAMKERTEAFALT